MNSTDGIVIPWRAITGHSGFLMGRMNKKEGEVRFEVLGVTINYPDYMGFDRKPDPKRFEHTDITIQVKGKRTHLFNILGLGEHWEHFDKGWNKVAVWDAPIDHLVKGESRTVLDRLQHLGYLDELQVAEIRSYQESSCGGCVGAKQEKEAT